jgi:hypothetical protein
MQVRYQLRQRPVGTTLDGWSIRIEPFEVGEPADGPGTIA